MTTLEKNLLATIEVKRLMLDDLDLLDRFEKAVAAVLQAYQSGGRLLIAGNGGSAADAQHLAAEFVGKLARVREALPAEALSTDSSILTSIGNDFGFRYVFSRQLEGKARRNDVFLGISTSGSSENIIEALRTCSKLGVRSILFTGDNPGAAAKLADYVISVPSKVTSQIQEAHIVLEHSLCEVVESSMFPERT